MYIIWHNILYSIKMSSLIIQIFILEFLKIILNQTLNRLREERNHCQINILYTFRGIIFNNFGMKHCCTLLHEFFFLSTQTDPKKTQRKHIFKIIWLQIHSVQIFQGKNLYQLYKIKQSWYIIMHQEKEENKYSRYRRQQSKKVEIVALDVFECNGDKKHDCFHR